MQEKVTLKPGIEKNYSRIPIDLSRPNVMTLKFNFRRWVLVYRYDYKNAHFSFNEAVENCL